MTEEVEGDRSLVEVYAALIADRVRALGIADPSIAVWAAPIIHEMERDGASPAQIAKRIREEGVPLGPTSRREEGLPPRLQVGRTFLEALTPLGRTDINRAALAIAHYPGRQYGRALMRALAERDGVKARMLIRDDDRTCTQALQFRRKVLSLAAVPEFPLPGCDQWVCRCGFDRSNEREFLGWLAPKKRRSRSAGPGFSAQHMLGGALLLLVLLVWALS